MSSISRTVFFQPALPALPILFLGQKDAPELLDTHDLYQKSAFLSCQHDNIISVQFLCGKYLKNVSFEISRVIIPNENYYILWFMDFFGYKVGYQCLKSVVFCSILSNTYSGTDRSHFHVCTRSVRPSIQMHREVYQKPHHRPGTY